MVFGLVVSGRVSAEDRRQDLDRLRVEIAELESTLDRLERRSHDLEEQLAETGLQLRLQEMRVAEAVAEHQRAESAWRETEERVEELEGRLAVLAEELRARLLSLYRLGGQGYLRLLLAVEDGSRALEALRQIRFLVRADLRSLDRFRRQREELDVERAALLQRQREVEAWVDAEVERRREMEAVRERQERLHRRLERERGARSAEAADLRDREQRLSRFLELLDAGGEALAGTPIGELRGAIDWPLEGRVVTPFGPRRDPRYGTLVPNNGIDIEAAADGTTVRVVYPGRVIYAAPFQGYGYTAVVRHPGAALTLYAGLRELSVAVDDVLALQDAVGVAGPRLYFELRVENRPVDPVAWLRRAALGPNPEPAP